MNTDAKILTEYLQTELDSMLKGLYSYIPLGNSIYSWNTKMVQDRKIGQSNVSPSTKGRGKNHMSISMEAEIAFDKTQQSFMIKTLNKIQTEGNYFHIIKSIYEK